MDNFRTLLQRSIYERLRLALVSEGYTPDVTIYENTPVGYQAYQTALKDLQIANDFSVELFNHGTVRDKGLKKVPRITLDYAPLVMGEWGSENKSYPQFDGSLYQYYYDDIVSLEMLFYCRVITESTSQARILNQLVLQVLPPLSFHPYYTDQDQQFLIEFITMSDVSDGQSNTREDVYLYKVPDVVANEGVPLNQSVPPIENIQLSIYLGLS